MTSDPVRYARIAAVLEAEPALGLGSPTVAWADAALRVMRQLQSPSFPARIRQPILIAAAGRDQLVSTAAIENFAIHLRAGSHLIIAGAQHEILMEQDQLPQSVLGRVRRLRARHAAVRGIGAAGFASASLRALGSAFGKPKDRLCEAISRAVH